MGADKVLLRSIEKEGWPFYLNSKTMIKRKASPRTGLKLRGYVSAMMGSGRTQHDPQAEVKEGW